MMPIVRIPDEIYSRLESLAQGFDTPAKVIERLLDAHGAKNDNASSRTMPANSRQLHLERTNSESTILEKADVPKKNEVTLEMAKKTCELGDKVYERSLDADSAIAELKRVGMNPRTAKVYLLTYTNMLEGKRFTHSASNVHVSVFMEHIMKKYGQAIFSKAVASLGQHIEYRKGTSKSTVGLQKIFENMREKL